MRIKALLATGGALALGVALSACGGTPPPATSNAGGASGGTNTGGGVAYATGSPAASSSQPWTLGTTDVITKIDPAGAYDIGSWNLQYEIFQQLMSVPAGETTPKPDAADCKYTDPKTVDCTLKAGEKFSNGDPLDSAAVKYSFERNIAINDPNGAAVLLHSITDDSDAAHPKLAAGAIDTPSPTEVVFHLNAPDLTFMQVITTAAASIVDPKVYPATKELKDTDPQVGSGPYELAQYKPGVQAVFTTNPNYTGDHPGIAPKVFVSFYKDDTSLTSDIQSGAVDVAWRSITPQEQNTLASSGTSVLNGKGSEFRYWVWDMNGNGVGTQQAVRQAAAYLIDRNAISQDAYDGTVTPSYSLVPPGFGGQKDSFKDAYGDSPNVDAAKKVLSDAGVSTPVTLKIGYTSDHYGSLSVNEANELVEELNDSGLFKASASGEEWEQYQTDYKKDAFDLYMLGWFPDYVDADDYLQPFVVNGGFFQNGYKNEQVNQLVQQEEGETDTSKRNDEIGQIQDIVAKDVPLIPSWNGGNVAAVGPGMGGVQDTLDTTYQLRFWMITKS